MSVAQIQAMFSQVDPSVVQAVFEGLGHDAHATVEYLLTECGEPEPAPPSASATRASATDPVRRFDILSNVPADVFAIICDYLELFELGRVAQMNRTCNRLTAAAFDRWKSFNMAKFRTWGDIRMLRLLHKFTKLESVSMANMCDEDVIPLVSWLPSLQALDLSHATISDDALETVCQSAHGAQLERVSLSGCKMLTHAGVSYLLDSLPRLSQLDIKGTQMNDNISKWFRNPGSRLSKLDLSACSQLSVVILDSPYCLIRDLNLGSCNNLRRLTVGLRELRSLNVSNSKQLILIDLKATPQLATLVANGCFTLAAVRAPLPAPTPSTAASSSSSSSSPAPVPVPAPPTKIHTLSIAHCRAISVPAFLSLIDACSSTLQTLQTQSLLQLDEATAPRVLSRCSQLREWDMSACRGIGVTATQEVQQELSRRVAAALQPPVGVSNPPPSAHRSRSTPMSPIPGLDELSLSPSLSAAGPAAPFW